MSFHPEQERHDALLEAIHRAAHLVSTAITEGFKHMADTEAQAIADLTAAVTSIADAVAGEIAALQAALSAQGVDHSPAIETAVTNLNNLTASLKASVPAPVASAPVPAPPAS